MSKSDHLPSYWDHTGKYQDLYELALEKLIPASGEVPEPKKNKALEKLRRAANCYYDLFNNGLCNRAAEFRRVFGFGGKVIVDRNYRQSLPESVRLEEMMDEIIMAAAIEQLGKLVVEKE